MNRAGLLHTYYVMKFNVGDLVWIVSACKDGMVYEPPAIILSVYEDIPKIFPYNKDENKKWTQSEGIGITTVYDILHNKNVENAVMAEWLRPFVTKEKY